MFPLLQEYYSIHLLCWTTDYVQVKGCKSCGGAALVRNMPVQGHIWFHGIICTTSAAANYLVIVIPYLANFSKMGNHFLVDVCRSIDLVLG